MIVPCPSAVTSLMRPSVIAFCRPSHMPEGFPFIFFALARESELLLSTVSILHVPELLALFRHQRLTSLMLGSFWN